MMDLTEENIKHYAARYSDFPKDQIVEDEMKQLLITQKFLTKEQLVKIGVWKSPRVKKHYENNDAPAVEEITRFSFSAQTEQARIGSLFALNGVGFPVASVILHFAFPERYPILDFRALESLGWDQPNDYSFDFWNRYCTEIQRLAAQFNLPLRTIDKALWQYSSENQRSKREAPA